MILRILNTDVVIVGAGPVGMSLAILLQNANVDVIIIDKRHERTELPRAIAINQESLKLFDSFGMLNDMQNQAMIIYEIEVFWNTKHIGDINFKNVQTRYPYFFHLSQNHVEKYLNNYIIKKNINLFRGHNLYKIENISQKPLSFINTIDNEYKINSKYVIGADGGQSTIRDLINSQPKIEFYNSYFMLFDVLIEEMVFKSTRYFFGIEGYCMLVPKGKNQYRIIMSFESNPSEILVKNNLIRFIENNVNNRTKIEIKVLKVEWYTYSTFGHKIADCIVKDKIILAGDALHQFSPIGGTNMNFGLQDAVFLSEIIPIMLSNHDDSLLQKYTNDRQFSIQKQLNLTKKLTRLLTKKNGGSISEYKKLYKMLKTGTISNFLTGNYLGNI